MRPEDLLEGAGAVQELRPDRAGEDPAPQAKAGARPGAAPEHVQVSQYSEGAFPRGLVFGVSGH